MRNTPLQVLVVEDHAQSANCLAKLLRDRKYVVSVVNTGHEAIGLAREHCFDVVLCDIGLPDIDGCELLTQLASIWPTRGIAVTGYAMAEDIERYHAAGFVSHILKPYAFVDVVAAIQSAASKSGPLAIAR